MDKLCELFGKSRQAYYKQINYHYKKGVKDELIIRFVKRQRKLMPKLGARKLHYMIKEQLPSDLQIGRDRLFDLLREQGMLVKRHRYRVKTTYSDHWMRKYPNLIKDFEPNGPHQLWVGDITYILTEQGFVYLYLITDAYSRKIVGWELADNLDAINAIGALKRSLRQLPKEVKDLIHHSDRGAQYCSNKYVKILKSRGVKISMTENGDPLENAIAERVNGIIKNEWLYGERLMQESAVQKEVKKIITTYNNKRPHLSISLLTPSQAHQKRGKLRRKWKNYYAKRTIAEKVEIDV